MITFTSNNFKKLRSFFFKAICTVLVLMFLSCELIKTKQQPTTNVARINDTYLSKADISTVLPKNLSPEDSVIFVKNYMDKWAIKQLLLEKARKNLPEEQQQEFNVMVNNYRQELYTEAYKDMIIEHQMDTVVTPEQYDSYFQENKQKYKLDRDIVKLRYIRLPKDYKEVDKIKKMLKRFDQEDKENLDIHTSLSDFYYLNDSLWLEAKNMTSILHAPELSSDDKNYLKKGNFLEYNDSISLYLIFIKDVRLRDEEAPESFLKPRIKRIILNKRKLEFEKKLEKRILDDALENNKFETYN